MMCRELLSFLNEIHPSLLKERDFTPFSLRRRAGDEVN
jgi:hypothetical protein